MKQLTSQTLDCSFYLNFIENPIKCASEDIPLQEISIVCSLNSG